MCLTTIEIPPPTLPLQPRCATSDRRAPEFPRGQYSSKSPCPTAPEISPVLPDIKPILADTPFILPNTSSTLRPLFGCLDSILLANWRVC